MDHDTNDGPPDHPANERYRVESVLGQGGTAIVERVFDRSLNRHVARKRMVTPPGSQTSKTAVTLFEREYLTLVQLSHPCVVEVYDYGVDADGPYYTMELLDGGDLQGLAPVPWQRACMIARDVCSALALLHSRRMVYRDLSPRNVRCTSGGSAKLIDFGALTPMGPSREFVGTLPIVPPEALNQQSLDGRTDLYALGATLYFSLVQRHAYPARDAAQLRDIWRSRPRRPSELVPGIPQALDELVVDLMNLDPNVRPASASEVIARLSAIAGLRTSEHQLVSQAYLASPTIVGRTEQLSQARKLMFRALNKRGAALTIQGAAGAGRSRMLDAYVLEAKVAGLVVLRTDPSDAQDGNYGVVRSLIDQLIKSVGPNVLALAEVDLPLLAHAIPQLLQHRPELVLAADYDPAQQRARVQQALRHWLLAVTYKRPLMLAIDDLPRIDDASAACLALLAQEVGHHGLLIAASVCAEDDLSGSSTRGAVELFASSSTAVPLEPLTLEETEQLLRSVFGAVPNLSVLGHYLQQVSAGNPRDIMRLAQHLVSEQVVRYKAGAWSLPARLELSGLPASMAEALQIRVSRLTAEARELALSFAFEPKKTFSFEECGALAPTVSELTPAILLKLLDELVASEVLLYRGGRYGLRQAAWAASIEAAASAPQAAAAHLRLAEHFAAGEDGFRASQHFLKGGALDRGLDTLIEHAVQSERRTDADVQVFYELLSTLPPDWLSTYELGLRLCQEHNRPAKQADQLRSRLAALVSFAATETDGFAHLEARLQQLKRACGLEDWAALANELDPGTRLKRSLEAAGARFMNTPPHDRLGDPGWAITQITKSTLAALGAVTFTLDYAALCRLPSLAPLIPLSPSMDVVCRLVRGLGARLVGRIEESYSVYQSLLERLAQPDRAGLPEAHTETTRLRMVQGLGMLDAAMGRASSLEHAKEVERNPIFAIQGMFVRHIYLVWQGDADQADRYKQEIEVARLESNARYGFEGQHLLSELVAYAMCDDMTRVKRAADAVEPRARIHRAWLPVVHYGRGEYQRICGDLEAALSEHQSALALMEDGTNQVWVYTAAAHVRTLSALGRHAEACERAGVYLRAADGLGIGYLRNHIRMPFSLALSKSDNLVEAIMLADQVIDELVALGSTGLLLASAYETRARIAREAEDQPGFVRFAALCTQHWAGGEKRLMGAKYQRHASSGSDPDASVLEELSMLSMFSSVVENCKSSSERARLGLDFLVRQSGATAGVLYAHGKKGLSRTASVGGLEPDSELDDWASDYFMNELVETDETAANSGPPPPPDTNERHEHEGRRFVRVLLTHRSDLGVGITGLALLVTQDDGGFIYPARLAAALSLTLADEDDVETLYS